MFVSLSDWCERPVGVDLNLANKLCVTSPHFSVAIICLGLTLEKAKVTAPASQLASEAMQATVVVYLCAELSRVSFFSVSLLQ